MPTRGVLPFGALPVLLICTLLSGCRGHDYHYTHKNDGDDAFRKAGWQRSIGTDHKAGNNEFIFLDDLSMEWSARSAGSGYLYAHEPLSNRIAWSFGGDTPASERVMQVEDGMQVDATHQSGATYRIKIVRQTDYYIKVFYRRILENEGFFGGQVMEPYEVIVDERSLVFNLALFLPWVCLLTVVALFGGLIWLLLRRRGRDSQGPDLASVERIAEERGKAKGGAAVLVGPLTRVCGTLPDKLENRLFRLTLQQLKQLGEAVFDFRSVEDLQEWLDAHEEPMPPAE